MLPSESVVAPPLLHPHQQYETAKPELTPNDVIGLFGKVKVQKPGAADVHSLSSAFPCAVVKTGSESRQICVNLNTYGSRIYIKRVMS